MKKPKGFNRRRRYLCCQCLGEILEYPGLVVDSAFLWCSDCQEKDDARNNGEETEGGTP